MINSSEGDYVTYLSILNFLVNYRRIDVNGNDNNVYTEIPLGNIFGIISKLSERKSFTKIILHKEITTFTDGTATDENTLSVTTDYADSALLNIISNIIKTLYYDSLEFNWIGYLSLNIGELVQVFLNDGTSYKTIMLQNTIKFDGYFSFPTKSPATSRNESSSNNAGGI